MTNGSDRAAGLQVTDERATAVLVSSTSGELVRVPIEVESILTLDPSGESTLGAPTSTSADTATGFADRVGAPGGVVSAHGVPLRAEDLYATSLFLLLREFADAEGTLPPATAVHPESWSAARVETLREAMDFTGLTGVALVADTAELRAAGAGGHDGLDSVIGAARSHSGGGVPVPYAEPITEEFEPAPATGAATAYAQAVLPADQSAPTPEPDPRSAGATRRTALLVGAVVVAAMLLTAGVVGVITQASSETEIPPIDNAEGTTTSFAPIPTAAVTAPVTFPTVDPAASLPVVPEPVVVAPVVETEAPVFVPPPPPPPVDPAPPLITIPPIVIVTELPVEIPVVTEPETSTPETTEEEVVTLPGGRTLPREFPFN